MLGLCASTLARKRIASTRTFRIDSEILDVLERDAESKGITTSSLLNQILRQYALSLRYDEAMNSTVLGAPLDLLVDQLSDESLKAIAQKAGQVSPWEKLMERGKQPNYEGLLFLMEEIYGRYHGWFKCAASENEKEQTFYLSHHRGPKWGIFLASYLRSAFQSILDVDPEIRVGTSSVTLTIPKKALKP